MTDHQHTDTSLAALAARRLAAGFTLPQLLQTYRLRLFYGDLHNHTGYSDGLGRPPGGLAADAGTWVALRRHHGPRGIFRS